MKTEFATGTLDQPPTGLDTPSIRPNRALVLIPVAGLIALMAAISAYKPVDRTLFILLGPLLFFGSVLLISHVQQKSRRGEDVTSFFPIIYWVALGPAVAGFALWANGAMDHRPIESHREVVTRTYISHTKNGTSYHIEFTSWRSNQTTEQAAVSFQQYHTLHADDPITVDVHPGALGIAWFGRIRKAD